MSEPGSLREKHALERRGRIIGASRTLFLAKGYEATTVDEIAALADVSPRTFFRYFPTKEAVLFHDLDGRLADLEDKIRSRPADEPAGVTLVEVLCAMLDDLESTPEDRQLLLHVLAEQPELIGYQRRTILEHGDHVVVNALSERVGRTGDDIGLRALVASVAACFDLALREWATDGAGDAFRPLFEAALRACVTELDALGDALGPPTP